ncbi:unnamed protein product [Tuber aestivum]|uniref:Uncharacterized protein n=1 Tax=Tuber aestivum TaxID=59557 RepID=A0A292PJ62_9PEZI|nr:unnamed protein product [Tuber aestivum]
MSMDSLTPYATILCINARSQNPQPAHPQLRPTVQYSTSTAQHGRVHTAPQKSSLPPFPMLPSIHPSNPSSFLSFLRPARGSPQCCSSEWMCCRRWMAGHKRSLESGSRSWGFRAVRRGPVRVRYSTECVLRGKKGNLAYVILPDSHNFT